MRSNGKNRRTEQPAPLARRFNGGKPKISRIFDAPNALEGVARVLEYGDQKYDRGNWRKGLSWSEVMDSLLRHMAAFNSNEDVDKESGLPHTDHILCNALFLAQYFREGTGVDDRMGDLLTKKEKV